MLTGRNTGSGCFSNAQLQTMKLVISKSVTTRINLILTVECKYKYGETKNPTAAGEVITQKFDFVVIL